MKINTLGDWSLGQQIWINWHATYLNVVIHSIKLNSSIFSNTHTPLHYKKKGSARTNESPDPNDENARSAFIFLERKN